MPAVTYQLPDGSVREIDVPCGQSVMDGSVRNNLLEFADGVQPNSRLSCQLIVTDGCDGVRVQVPDTNG